MGVLGNAASSFPAYFALYVSIPQLPLDLILES